MPPEPAPLQQAIPLILGFAAVGCWLTLAAVLAKGAKLPEHHKWWANLLTVFAGPLGWLYHYAGHKGWISIRDEEEHAVMAGIQTNEAQPVLSRLRIAFSGKRRREGDLPTETETVRLMLAAAQDLRATDIHLEPHGEEYLVRLRVNGILREHTRFQHEHGERVVSALKVMAAMDIADKHRMQDGRFDWSAGPSAVKVDLRVSTSPSLNGEKMAIRFLNRQISQLALEQLGMPDELLATLRRGMRHIEGLVLIAGPTGSGKTSTAYSILQTVAGPTVNTMTIEDPVEYSLPFATQIGVNPKAGISFESGLRTLLRQDPNVIFVGEMRDPESFRIGIRASLSGHLVITTMHARDTVGVMTTLRTLGVDKETLSTALKLVVSQRLVRVLCPECKLPDEDVDQESRDFLEGADASPLRKPNPAGCPHCARSGFVSRIGVFEYLRPESVVQDWLASNQPESALREALRRENHVFLRDHARERVLAGEVWINDAIRSVGFDDT
jgi:general secretion pathway protein E/type IV pilus assembly protein PilB